MSNLIVIDSDLKMRRELCALFSANGMPAAPAAHGVEAAQLMMKTPPSLVLVDEAVPMGGIKTAQIIRMNPAFKEIPILLGLRLGAPDRVRDTLREAIRKGITWALARPYKPEALLEKVRDLLEGKVPAKKPTPEKPDNAEAIRAQLKELKELPVLSATQQKVITLMSVDDDQVDMQALVDAIQVDQALAMRTMRIAGSAAFGFRGNALSSAVTFLGVQKMRQIIQSATILEIFSGQGGGKEGGLQIDRFWEHSIATGVVMQMISRDNKAGNHFMAGMLHDVGKLVLEIAFQPFSREVELASLARMLPRDHVERALIGITHGEIGKELVDMWDLPPEIGECIGNHHSPANAFRHKLLTALVYTANYAVRRMGIGQSGSHDEPAFEDEFARKVRLPIGMDDLIGKRNQVYEQVQAIMAPV